MIAHNTAQGQIGSGFDVAAAVYGSILYQRVMYEHDEDLYGMSLSDYIVPYNWPHEWHVLLFNDGQHGSSSSTRAQQFLAWYHSDDHTDCINEIQECIDLIISASRTIDAALLKKAMSQLTLLYHALGQHCGIDVIPDAYLTCFNTLMQQDHILGAHCPGAGGYDAFYVITLTPEKAISSLHAICLLYTSPSPRD